MTDSLDRIWVRPRLKRKIKADAAREGMTMHDFLEKRLDDKKDFMEVPRRKKIRGFDFGF